MNKQVTDVGRFLRKLRLDNNEVLFDMAKKLECSSAFISAIELGKRPIPYDLQQKLIKIYNLSEDQQKDFQRAIDQSAKSVTIGFDELSDNSKELALVFARRLRTMEDTEAEKLLNLLNNQNKGENNK